MAVSRVVWFESISNGQLEKTILDRVLYVGDPLLLNEILLKKVTVDYFTVELHKNIYTYLLENFTQLGTVPTVAAIESLFPQFITSPITDSISPHLEELIYRWTEKTARETLTKVQGIIDSGANPVALLAELQQLYTMERSKKGEKYFIWSSMKFVDSYQERINSKEDFTGLKVGLPYIDDALGWILPTDFIGLLADEKVGKSWIMLWLSYQCMKQGKNVVFFSPEMWNDEVLTRLHLIHNRMSAKNLQQGLLTEEDISAWRSKSSWLKQLQKNTGGEFITIDDIELEDLNVTTMKARIKKISTKLRAGYIKLFPAKKEYYEAKANLVDLIVIDGFHLMNGQDIVSSKASEWKELQKVSQKLRSWARIEQIPILISLHTNRDKQNKLEKIIPDARDTSLTASLWRDLTALISLFSTPKLVEKNSLGMACTLSRRSPKKVWNVKFLPEEGTIEANGNLQSEQEFLDSEKEWGFM